MATFKIQNSQGQIIELPIEQKYLVTSLLEKEDYEGIDKLVQFQMGGQPEVEIMKRIAKALQEGQEPEAVFNYLLQQGYEESVAQQMIQSVIEALQEEQQMQQQQQMAQQQQLPPQTGQQPIEQSMSMQPMEYKEGGELEKYEYGDEYKHKDDELTTITQRRSYDNLDNKLWNTIKGINQLGSPYNPLLYGTNKGIMGKIKAASGMLAGVSGAAMGYGKLFANDKVTNKLYNPTTGEQGNPDDIYAQRKGVSESEHKDKLRKAMEDPEYRKLFERGAVPEYEEERIDSFNEFLPNQNVFSIKYPEYIQPNITKPEYKVPFRKGGELPKAQVGQQVMPTYEELYQYYLNKPYTPDEQKPIYPELRKDVKQYPYIISNMDYNPFNSMWSVGNMSGLAGNVDEMMPNNIATSYGVWKQRSKEKGVTDPHNIASWLNYLKSEEAQKNKVNWTKGDPKGIMAANRSLIGLASANEALSDMDLENQYSELAINQGNTMNKYNPIFRSSDRGDYTLNTSFGHNFRPQYMTHPQYAKEGGEVYLTDEEIDEIVKNGGEIEFLD